MQTVLENSLIVLDTVPEAYARFDSQLRLTFVNQAAQALLGTTRADLLGKTLSDLHPVSFGTSLQESCHRALAEHGTVRLEHYSEPWRRWYGIAAIPESSGGIVVQFSDITDRKLMEDSLRKSKEKFHKVFQSSPAPMCIVDVDKNACFLEVNDAFERITGYRRDEIIGHTSTELALYEESRDLVESRKQLLTNGGYRNLEVRFRNKSGDVITGLISAEQIELDGNLCAIAVAVDVTEQRRTEEALRESEELYRQLFDVESDAILVVDQETGGLLAANAAATVLYGYSREELLSMNRIDLSAEPEKTIRAAMEMATFIPLRWHRRKDGAVFPVEISGRYFDLKGRSCFVSAIRDITARKVMEEALKKSEEKFSKAFHSNPAAITIADLGRKAYLEVNEAFEEMTGYRRDEVVGRDWDELAFLTDPHGWDKTVAQLMKEGRLRNCEFHFHKKNGDSGAGLLSAELIEVEGKPCAITAIVDITERLRLESQLRQAQKLESVGRLAGGVAHDFNNLLTLVNGYGDAVLKGLRPTDPLYPYAEEIKRVAEHAASLTKQLLTFSRKQVIQPRALDMNTIVNDAERMLQRLIGEDIELVTTIDPLLGQVMADPDQIHQVIMNLVVNARDAMPEGGKLEITMKNVDVDEGSMAAHPDVVPGSYVLMTITDTGVGMDEDILQSAFEPFFTTKQPGEGTGLGLSTVYGIVRQSGGWIHVRSAVGQGTSCRIYLPRIHASSVPNRAESDTAKALYGVETVLVIEDNEAVRRLTTTILKEYGYQVLEAANSTEAFAVEKEHSGEIHLLLTDVILPGMNGMALSERLRALRPRLKVLFTSGYTADVIARRGVLQQDVAYLQKPFGPESLAAKVREVLTEPSAAHRTGGPSI